MTTASGRNCLPRPSLTHRGSRRLRVVRLHPIRLLVRLLTEELDPLLLEAGIAQRGLDEIEEAAERLVETLLEQVVLQSAVLGERLVRLRQGEHVRVHPRAQVLERNPQRPEPAV